MGLVLAASLFAQRPAHFEHRNADLVHALDLFDKEKYGAAQTELERVTARISDAHDGTRVESEFWSAICAVRLFHNDAPLRLLGFIDAHPESQHVPAVRLELFRHYFAQKRWEDCLTWGTKVEPLTLEVKDQEEFYFKRGYASFMEEKHDAAMNDFTRIKDGASGLPGSPGNYVSPATYYSAHINYERGQYETALKGFEKLKGDEAFGDIVPHYISEILFLQGKYDELKQYAKPIVENPDGQRRINEMSRLLGESNYRQGNYAEAIPHLEKSVQRAGVTREDRYVLGHAYYKTGNCEKALQQLTMVANGTDSLAQAAAYHMGDCYMKLDQKNYARTAFKKAYDLKQDPRVTEDALFNYAKLAYELSFDPYNEAIIALKNYLKAYPDSPKRDDAYGFLLNVYLKTRNYEAALEALDKIQQKDIAMQEAYQKLAYDRGVELYDGRKFKDAALFFDRALKYPVNKDLNARCHYWTAECFYAEEDYTAALRKYDVLRNASGAYATDLYEQAGYSQGYCYFKMKEYPDAATSFRRFVGTTAGDPAQRADAKLRVGDCYYMAKDWAQSINWYEDALKSNTSDRDYATYQKGMCQGLTGLHGAKVETLKKLLADKPNSRYAPDAKFQLGETYIRLDNDAQAATYYQQVITDHSESPFVQKSMLQVALIHKRQGDNETALQEFKAIVSKYPTRGASADALASIEAIYVETGRVAEWESYFRGLSFVNQSEAEAKLDENYYRSAEQLYFDDKCDQAIGAFGSYLVKYPTGANATKAHFYKGDCHYKAAQYSEALTDLEEVVKVEGNENMEKALFYTSDILYRDKRWEGALEHLVRLERISTYPDNVLAAQVGQMRCARELGRSAEAAAAAEKVLANTQNKDALVKAEAQMIIANQALDLDDKDGAYTKYKQIAAGKHGAMSAEAKYRMAYIKHLQAKYKEAEKEVFALANDFGGYQHWISMGFILLGDVYVQLGDRFQAKAAWQGVIDNSDEPDLVADARNRLTILLNEEQQQNSPAPGQDGDGN